MCVFCLMHTIVGMFGDVHILVQHKSGAVHGSCYASLVGL